MEQSYWHKQGETPLFPEIEWSRPENRSHAGKLLIVGGNSQGFASVAEAYASATKAGIGTARALLPNRLQKTVGKLFPEADFAMSNPSGGFSQMALADFCDFAEWADAVMLAGDLSRNSETTVLLENFVDKYTGPITITKDAADVFCTQPIAVSHRPETLLVISMSQLQKLGVGARFARAFTSEMGLVKLVETLHEFTKRFEPYFIVRYQDTVLVAVEGQISTTKTDSAERIWRVKTAATAATWWLQVPQKPFEALTTAIHVQ